MQEPQMHLGWNRNRYDFSWETLRSFLDGVSPIDLHRLALTSREEARQFLIWYGYDLASPSEHHEAWQVFRQGLDYIGRVLCPAPTPDDVGLELPQALHELEDLTDLLVLASRPGELQPWACALLRVMHTISHANHAVRSPYYSQIQAQILERYRQHVYTDPKGNLFLGRGLLAVPLDEIHLREEKNPDSLILKLLHKPANVAQSVYDRIGVRLVTPSKVDALLVLKYIRKHHLAIFANIMPGRSRNTLINLERFRRVYENIASPGPSSLKDDWSELQTQEAPAPNPHSDPGFRSIQFTCRQLIRIPNPQYSALARLREQLNDRLPRQEVEGLLDELTLANPEPVLRFFFPYEVQILDRENHLRTQHGSSSHANYRLRQLKTARTRVLGDLLAEAKDDVAPDQPIVATAAQPGPD